MNEIVSDIVSGDFLNIVRGFDFVEIRLIGDWNGPVMNCIF